MPRPLRRESSEAGSLKRSATPKRGCKDCGSTSRALKAPGPRCTTCQRARKKALSEASWARGILARYGLTSEQYWALYEAQGGACFICRRATGKARRLAVDHDHATGFVRMLACGPCNSMLAHARDDPDAFRRAIIALEAPPAHDAIGKVRSDGWEPGE